MAPDGLARMAAFLEESRAEPASGIPLQETGTLVEKLVIPLIHFVLLGFLPLARCAAADTLPTPPAAGNSSSHGVGPTKQPADMR